MLDSSGIGIAVMDGPIDSPFMQFIEYKNADKQLKFARIDSDVADSMRSSASEKEKEAMEKLSSLVEADFRKASSNESLLFVPTP